MDSELKLIDQLILAAGTGFEETYATAREYDDALSKGDEKKLSKFNFQVIGICLNCFARCFDRATMESKPLVCSGCKAVVYCSRACQVKHWKTPSTPRDPTHKKLCASNREYMKRLPDFRAVLQQFPWARIEFDGTFCGEILKARFKVLGSGPEFGYWSVRGGFQPHDTGSSALKQLTNPSPELVQSLMNPSSSKAKGKAPKKEYIHGEVMLGTEWQSDIDAWKLENKSLIPRLFFNDEYQPPEKPQVGQINDWKSWYEWRKLPLESPAALLMDYPLSVYHLLVDVLKVAEVSSEKRQDLTVHFVGAEVELNLLPLFSELALLLPNTHLTLIVFGKPAYELVLQARRSSPSSIAATRDTVWSYKAPNHSGGGSIDIKLYSDADSWSPQVISHMPLPDAIVACNAGLFCYAPWMEVIAISGSLNIPFAVTEYEEQILCACACELPAVFAQYAACISDVTSQGDLKKTRSHPVTVNPFHRPGQRPMPCVRTPNLYNGFAMPVVMPADK